MRLFLLLLMACGGSTSESPSAAPTATPEPPPVATPIPPATTPPAAKPSLVVGMLRFDGDAARFVPCGTESVADLGAVPPDLAAAHLATAREPGVDVLAHVDASVSEGKTFILGWRRMLQGGECGQVLPQGSWWAKGNEPFWSMVSGGKSAMLHTPDTPNGTAFTVTGTSRKGSTRVHTLTGGDGTMQTLELTPAMCADSMADARYSHTARLVSADTVVEGCAMRLD